MQSIEVRPMPTASLARELIDGPAGKIETDVTDPDSTRRGIALIAHPTPGQGGTKDNKVVTTLAKVFFSLGYVAARPNFRGIGASEGSHDEGRGETDDLVTVAGHLRRDARVGVPFGRRGRCALDGRDGRRRQGGRGRGVR